MPNFIRSVKAAKPGFVAQLMHAYISSFPRVAVLRTDSLSREFPTLLRALQIPTPPKFPDALNVTQDGNASA